MPKRIGICRRPRRKKRLHPSPSQMASKVAKCAAVPKEGTSVNPLDDLGPNASVLEKPGVVERLL